MNAILKHHLNDHAEVLSQYMANRTTDKTILAWLIKRLLLKLFKREYINYALEYINIADIAQFHVKLADKLGNDLADDIIDAVNKHLKKNAKKQNGTQS